VLDPNDPKTAGEQIKARLHFTTKNAALPDDDSVIQVHQDAWLNAYFVL